MGCERPIAIAVIAARSYHGLIADLECVYLSRDSGDRSDAIVELTVHESTHAHNKPAGGCT
jgi:hypothetical protein